jgi:hypothetical protein
MIARQSYPMEGSRIIKYCILAFCHPKYRQSLLSSAHEVRSFEKGKIEIVNFESGVTIGRGTLEPGWSGEKCVEPIVKTDSCQVPHTSYIISGRMKVVMDDGTEVEGGPGDTDVIPPGHNAWGCWRRTMFND